MLHVGAVHSATLLSLGIWIDGGISDHKCAKHGTIVTVSCKDEIEQAGTTTRSHVSHRPHGDSPPNRIHTHTHQSGPNNEQCDTEDRISIDKARNFFNGTRLSLSILLDACAAAVSRVSEGC